MEQENDGAKMEMKTPPVVVEATRSVEIKDLAAALSKAQGEIGGAKKGAENPFFKSKYADLHSVKEAIREPFAKNGLSVLQRPYGKTGIETLLIHSSGQWMSGGKLEIAPGKQDAHGIGSAITYARRYTLMAVAGVAPEDDDGNAAVGKSGEKKKVEVKKPGANDKKPSDQELGKLKHGALESIEGLPEGKRPAWRKKVAACKTEAEVEKVNDDLAAELL